MNRPQAILTSPQVVSGTHSDQVWQVLLEYLNTNDQGAVLVVSIDARKLEGFPEHPRLFTFHMPSAARGNDQFVTWLNTTAGVSMDDIIIIGAAEKDFHMSVNSRVFYAVAGFEIEDFGSERWHGYGYQLRNIDDFTHFVRKLAVLAGLEREWFIDYEIAPDQHLLSLMTTNTTTNYENTQEEKLVIDALTKAIKGKGGSPGRFHKLVSFFTLSLFSYFKDIDVDVWGIAPSSDSTNLEGTMYHVKELARTLLSKGVRNLGPLIIRHTSIQKRHTRDWQWKNHDNCGSLFQSIHLNPAYKNKLKGATVVLIDDITTTGDTLEACRALLVAAGAAKIYLVTIGKFGPRYFMYDIALRGDIFAPGYQWTVTRKSQIDLPPFFNPKATSTVISWTNND